MAPRKQPYRPVSALVLGPGHWGVGGLRKHSYPPGRAPQAGRAMVGPGCCLYVARLLANEGPAVCLAKTPALRGRVS